MSPIKKTPAAINSNNNNYLNRTLLKNIPCQQRKMISIASGTFAIGLIATFGIATYRSWDNITHIFGIKTPAEETIISLIQTKTKPVLKSAGVVANFVGKYGWALTKSYYSNVWKITKSCYNYGSNFTESFCSNAWNLTQSGFSYYQGYNPTVLFSEKTRLSLAATTLILAKAPFSHPLLCKIQLFLNHRTPDPFSALKKASELSLVKKI